MPELPEVELTRRHLEPVLCGALIGRGRVSVTAPGTPEPPHTAVVVELRGGSEVRFIDPRTFGHSAVLTAAEMALAGPSRLGPDALDELPSSRWLVGRLARRTARIKVLLLDQRLVAGLGN